MIIIYHIYSIETLRRVGSYITAQFHSRLYTLKIKIMNMVVLNLNS